MSNISRNILVGVLSASLAGAISVCGQGTQPAQGGIRQAAPGQGQEGAKSEKEQIAQKLGELRNRLQKIDQELQGIAEEANAENPELSKKREEMYNLYEEKLQEHGYPSE